MKHDLELKLQAWLDGELPAAEAEEMRRLAAADTEAAGLLAELQNTKAALLQNEPTVTVPETRAFYWSKIERQIQRQAAEERHSRLAGQFAIDEHRFDAVGAEELDRLLGFVRLGARVRAELQRQRVRRQWLWWLVRHLRDRLYLRRGRQV